MDHLGPQAISISGFWNVFFGLSPTVSRLKCLLTKNVHTCTLGVTDKFCSSNLGLGNLLKNFAVEINKCWCCGSLEGEIFVWVFTVGVSWKVAELITAVFR